MVPSNYRSKEGTIMTIRKQIFQGIVGTFGVFMAALLIGCAPHENESLDQNANSGVSLAPVKMDDLISQAAQNVKKQDDQPVSEPDQFESESVEEPEEEFVHERTPVSSRDTKSTSQVLSEGEIVTGRVKKIMSYGAFVELAPGVDGLVHISEISQEYVNDVSDYLSVGDVIDVKILSIDRVRNRISLSIKAIQPGAWKNLPYHEGEVVRGEVVKLLDYGAFVELPAGVKGLLHISEITNERNVDVSDYVQLGDTIDVKIVSIDYARKRISLSIKRL